MMLSVFTTSLVLACSSAIAPADEPRDMTAVVAGWNIFGNRDFDNGLTSEQAAVIAEGLAYLDAEVVVLTEVKPKASLGHVLAALNTLGSEYLGAMIAQPGDLNIAIIHKKGVTVTNLRLLDDTDAGSDRHRKALAADVTIGQFDFVLIGVHFKSGRSVASHKIRDRQVAALAGHVASMTASAEKDVLIVGDYNMVPISDAMTFTALNPDDYLQFISLEDLSGQHSHIAPLGKPGNLLDGFAISQEHTNEYIDGSLRIFPLNRTFRMSLGGFQKGVSDHLPLVARFVITEDDD